MGKKIIVNKGDKFGFWEVIEPNIINPDTTNKAYINKSVFSKCVCTKCNKTIRYIINNQLKHVTQCKSCTLFERNTKDRMVQLNQKYGMLKVIGDAGYKERADGKRRHYSLCKCDCGNIVEVMDNALQTSNTISCGCLGSRGEKIIENILKANNISYNKDSIFPELIQETGRRLRFDFIIYNDDGTINRFIEFDGNQHKTGMWGGSWSNSETLDIIQERDIIKNEFCLKHNYILVRLPYYTINNMTLDKIMGNRYIYKEEE